MAAVARGEIGALAEIYDRNAAVVLRVAQRFLRSRQDAEDLVHDVFVEAWGRAGEYDPTRASVRRWLLIRTRSRAIDRLRALETARRHAMAEAARPPLPPTPPEPADPWDRDRARRALLELSAAQRRVIELCYFEGLSCAEVAARCEVPIGTVKSRLSAALARLRSSLATPAGAR